jgi:cytoskeletal protein RodZ
MHDETPEVKGPGDTRTKEKLPPSDRSGINTRAVMIFCAVLIMTAIIIHIAVLYLFKAFDNNEKERDPVLSPLTPKELQLPPEPRLEASPNTLNVDKQLFDPGAVQRLKDEAKQQLDNYGWVDDKNGIVRIPIQEAMKKVVEQAKQPQTVPNQTNKTAPTQTNKSSNVQK